MQLRDLRPSQSQPQPQQRPWQWLLFPVAVLSDIGDSLQLVHHQQAQNKAWETLNSSAVT